MRFLQLSTVLACVVLPGCSATAADSPCRYLTDKLDAAVAAKSLDEVKRLESLVSTDLGCVDLKASFRAVRAQLEMDLASDRDGPLRTETEREMVLIDAANHSDLWVADERLGDFLAGDRRWREAAVRYDTAIAKAARFASLTDEQKLRLLKKAGAAKVLASDDAEGTRQASLATSSRAADDGGVGGIYSPSLRGARPVPIPVPIQFETGSADLTPTGRQAADELLEALKEQGASEFDLVGHTDPRGTDAYNMRLSARRLASVKDYLTSKGATIRMSLLPKGKSEPFDTSVLSFKPSEEEVWALDRRVEWVR